MKPLIIFLLLPFFAGAQTYNAAYVKALYAKYPTVKSNLCPACKLWVNSYYTSIADTVKNYPVCEHTIVTADNVKAQEALNVPRSGVYAKWNVVGGSAHYDDVYSYVNGQINKPMSVFEVVYGHCVLAWVLGAYTKDGAILTNTETYGEFMEYQGQNIGTMIASEDTTRLLLGATLHLIKHVPLTSSIEIWAGCVSTDTVKDKTGKVLKFGSKVYKYNHKSVTVPDAVWKILKFNGQTVVYWMPNVVTEVQALLPKRHITYVELVKKIGFDPMKILK